MDEFDAARIQVQLELTIQSFGLETLQDRHAAKKLLTKEELRDKAMVVVEETR